MENDQEILAQASSSILQQRASLSKAGNGRGGEPKRLSFDERLRLMPAPAEPTPEEQTERAKLYARMAAERLAKEAEFRVTAVVDLVGRRYAGCSLSNFQTITPESGIVLGRVSKYLDELRANVRDGVGLVLLGPPGTGKDHLIVAVLKQAARDGFKVHWVDGGELFVSARDNIDSQTSEAAWSKRYTLPDILAISDPVPPVGEVKEGFQIGTLFRIIDRRYREQKPTLITINVADAREAAAKMSVNIVDRLAHGAVVLKCNWPSYRKPQ